MTTRKPSRRRRRSARHRPTSAVAVRPESRVTLRVPRGPSTDGLLRALGIAGGGWLPFLGSDALRDTEALDDPYLREARISAAINLKARTVSSVPLRLWDRDPDDDQAQDVRSGPLFDLLQRMAPGLDAALVEMVDSLNVDLAGDSIWFLRDAAGRPVSSVGFGQSAMIDLPADIVPVRGDRVTLELDTATGLPRVWRVACADASILREWSPAAVQAIWDLPHRTLQPWRGQSLVELLYGPALQNFLANRYQNFILKHDGSPAGVVSVELWPTDAQAETLRAEISDHWDNPAEAGKTKVLFGGATYNGTRVVPKDLEYGALRKANQSDMSEVLGTPPALLGEHQENFATFAGHMLAYIEQRIVPYLVAKAGRVNALIARLRDPAMRRHRVRYDTDALASRFRDVKALGDQIDALTRRGVPLNQAMLLVGLKIDPIEGGDEAMVSAGTEPLRLSVLKAQADTAIRLQQAGVPGPRSFALVGLQPGDFEELPDPVDPADDPPKPGTSDKPKAGDEEPKALPAPPARAALPAPDQQQHDGSGDPAPHSGSDAVRSGPEAAPTAPPAATPAERASSATERIQAWRHVQALQREVRTTLNGRVKRVLYAARNAQVRLLETFAATGRVERQAALDEALGVRAAPGASGGVVYRGAPPTVPAAALRGLWDAWREDVAEERQLEAAGDARLRETVVVDCMGNTDTRRRAWMPRQSRWAARYPAFARAGLGRCRDLAVLQRVQLTEAEIDQLILVADERWVEALAAKMRPLLEKAHRIAGRDIAAEVGIEWPDAVDPRVLVRIANRAAKVAEGSLSAVAQRLRSELIKTIAETGSTGTLQTIIRDSLVEVRATVGHVFNTSAARAGLIARQEVGTAVSQVRHEELVVAENEGVVKSREWVTSGRGPESAGGTVRESHFAMEGQVRPPGVPFTSGAGVNLDHPLDPDAPPEEIIGCQCVERGIVKEASDA